jgi:hypothetical protein
MCDDDREDRLLFVGAIAFVIGAAAGALTVVAVSWL